MQKAKARSAWRMRRFCAAGKAAFCPGLSGLAQVNGRNDIDWEDKLNWDLKYIKKISFFKDVWIIFQTVMKAFVKKEGITEGDMATAEDFGDYLLRTGKITQEEYERKQQEAREILVCRTRAA